MQPHEGISFREFARQLDVTAEGVRKAIASGKIPADCVGEITLTSGRKRPCIINPERAAQQWGRNRDPNQVRDKSVLTAGAKRGWEQRRGVAAKPSPPPRDEDDLDDDPPGSPLDRAAGLASGDRAGEQSIADYKRTKPGRRRSSMSSWSGPWFRPSWWRRSTST